MVTHAPLRKESNHNNKDGLPKFSGRPVLPSARPAFRSRLDLSAFQRVKQLLGDRSFLLVVFCKYIIPELSEKTLGARRAGPGR